jgi:hypothetical protein
MRRYYVSPDDKSKKQSELIASAFKQKHPQAFELLHKEAPWPELSSMAEEIENSFPKTFKQLEEETSDAFKDWLYDAEGHHSFDIE